MRKIILLIAVLALIVLIAACYPHYVQKPEKDGPGPLSVSIDPKFDAPEFHSPLDYWQSRHMHIVNRGDFEKTDCLYCHEPERSCNNCHGYVGVDPIAEAVP